MIKRVCLNVYNTKYNILIVSYRHQAEQKKMKIEFYVLCNQNEAIINYIETESYDDEVTFTTVITPQGKCN